MNRSAMEALTAPDPNERQRMVVRVAREMYHAHPTFSHANRDDAWASLVREAIDRDKTVMTRPSDRALTLLVNDIIDCWDYFIGATE